MDAVKLLIRGKVQGVGYRRWFEKEALKMELKGYVKNLESGEVEAVIVGDEQAIIGLIRHCHIGPLRAEVTSIEQSRLNHDTDYNEFTMIR
ncbi:acylphosphatase [Acinetobacter nematophilus]|uniref:acylphosphatase n=1 Tax=Acinetobacter nematophilus TaxID=2994642 RepID=A0A9X3DW71_9GAMM|nr:acylphosphatase [Acinetobacter nematophilus]MCX5469100.1 acylphosphatase [Acinetobacter nematophilus]